MSKNKEIEVLSGLRLIFKLGNLYNKNGVSIKYNKKSIKIPDFLVFCVILLPVPYYVTLMNWIVIREKFNLKLVSTNVANTIGILQVTIAYISLVMKTDSIMSTVDHLQEVVEKSKILL